MEGSFFPRGWGGGLCRHDLIALLKVPLPLRSKLSSFSQQDLSLTGAGLESPSTLTHDSSPWQSPQITKHLNSCAQRWPWKVGEGELFKGSLSFCIEGLSVLPCFGKKRCYHSVKRALLDTDPCINTPSE